MADSEYAMVADVAWLAGILEGEGCFSPTIRARGRVQQHKARMEDGRLRPARTSITRKQTGTAHVSLWMSDPDVVTRVVEVAAKVTGMAPRRIHEVQTKPAKGYTNTPKKGYRTDWCGESAVLLMRAIRPLMGARRGIAIDRQLDLFGKQQVLSIDYPIEVIGELTPEAWRDLADLSQRIASAVITGEAN